MRNCEDRRKRDVSQIAESLDDVYPLAQGPLTLEKEEEEEDDRQRTRSFVTSQGAKAIFFLISFSMKTIFEGLN